MGLPRSYVGLSVYGDGSLSVVKPLVDDVSRRAKTCIERRTYVYRALSMLRYRGRREVESTYFVAPLRESLHEYDHVTHNTDVAIEQEQDGHEIGLAPPDIFDFRAKGQEIVVIKYTCK